MHPGAIQPEKKVVKIVCCSPTIAAGKSTLLTRLVNDEFTPGAFSIGTNYFLLRLPDGKKINFWDTASQERYWSMSESYCRGADVFLLCCDMTEDLGRWLVRLKHMRAHSRENVPVILVLTKCDLIEKHKILMEEAQYFAAENNIDDVMMVSAKDRININELKQLIIDRAFFKVLNINVLGSPAQGKTILREYLVSGNVNLSVAADDAGNGTFNIGDTRFELSEIRDGSFYRYSKKDALFVLCYDASEPIGSLNRFFDLVRATQIQCALIIPIILVLTKCDVPNPHRITMQQVYDHAISVCRQDNLFIGAIIGTGISRTTRSQKFPQGTPINFEYLKTQIIRIGALTQDDLLYDEPNLSNFVYTYEEGLEEVIYNDSFFKRQFFGAYKRKAWQSGQPSQMQSKPHAMPKPESKPRPQPQPKPQPQPEAQPKPQPKPPTRPQPQPSSAVPKPDACDTWVYKGCILEFDSQFPRKVLGLTGSATSIEIKKRYRELALIYHPDKCVGDPLATIRFQKINGAFQQLH